MTEDIEQLRVRGIDLARRQADGDTELLALRPRLEQDTKLWWSLWAPSCALAALRLGDPGEAWRLLDAAVANGLHQHEMFELADLFGTDPRWPDLLRRLEANIPPAPIELLDWPDPVPSLPVALFRAAPAREAELRRRVPQPQASAWRTALDMLRWVHTRWEHTSTNHALGEDAVTSPGPGGRRRALRLPRVHGHPDPGAQRRRDSRSGGQRTRRELSRRGRHRPHDQ